ncbi:hypothetical protein Bca52824_033327 [Brassica carinata]|uniref:Ubiquitin-like protease family profile domain-containing protein n=1 Tax=Brassica carinata TaxID=52824 RepID=A0A8X7SE05_BRACI|nr:hypothetical protein Bca52824_033327 [Brassica carinata]
MPDGNGETTLSPEFQWSDDEDDVLVSNMVNLVDEGFGFVGSYFLGGATKQEVFKMKEEAKAELVNRKTVKSKSSTSSQMQDGLDIDILASIVRDKLKDDFQLLKASQKPFFLNVNEVFGVVQECVGQLASISADLHKQGASSHIATANRRPNVVNAGTQTIPDPTSIISDAIRFANRSSETAPASLDPSMVFPDPTFSLGLTQEGIVAPITNVMATIDSDHEVSDERDAEDSREEGGIGFRISKRQKVRTKSLMGEYQCDKGFINRARKAVADAIYKRGNTDYPAKFSVLLERMKTPFEISTERGNILSSDLAEIVKRATQLPTKVVDVMVFHTSALLQSPSSSAQQLSPAVFMDTHFVSQFTKLYTKFSKSSKKDTFKFNVPLVELFLCLAPNQNAVRFYFPFYLDKKYWVGICVDCSSWSITILDCNLSLRTDVMMNKEVRPFATMFPYFLKHVGREVGMRECKAMAIERPRSIPQQKEVTHSAISTVLFIQAHAVGGVDACKCITPDNLDSYVERLLVTLYEASVGPL